MIMVLRLQTQAIFLFFLFLSSNDFIAKIVSLDNPPKITKLTANYVHINDEKNSQKMMKKAEKSCSLFCFGKKMCTY